jgi:hypothetical protein
VARVDGTSKDAISKALRLRETGRQDLIDAVERGDMTLDAALEQAEGDQTKSCPMRHTPG